jgi:GH35 family endo-1,4-beta-xylanase
MTQAGGEPVYPDALYTVDDRGLPAWSEWCPEGDGIYAVRYPSAAPFTLVALWEVPGFGRVMVKADNAGRGYRVGAPGVVDFRLEAAQTKIRWLARRIEELERQGYTVPSAVTNEPARAGKLLDASRQAEGTARAQRADEALAVALWAGEALVLAKARADLAARSATARRGLRCGASFMSTVDAQSDGYLSAFAELFDFATLPFYRGRLQPTPEPVDWSSLDRALTWLDRRKIAAKGHPLVWPIKPSGLPRWMQKLSFKTLKDLVRRQVFETVSRFKDRIKIWDVINEAHDPVTLGAGHLPMSRDAVVELTAAACRAVQEADPEAVRIVNCNKVEGYYRADYEGEAPLHAIEYLELLGAAGVDYDVLGLQMYQGATEHWIGDMTEQDAILDRFSAFGKPIHITEVQVPSSMTGHTNYIRLHPAEGGWWHRPWDPELQADWVEQFYTIALSKPAVEAVTWWSLSDRRTFWPSGGLLDAADRPKPAYTRLKRLLSDVRMVTGL